MSNVLKVANNHLLSSSSKFKVLSFSWFLMECKTNWFPCMKYICLKLGIVSFLIATIYLITESSLFATWKEMSIMIKTDEWLTISQVVSSFMKPHIFRKYLFFRHFIEKHEHLHISQNVQCLVSPTSVFYQQLHAISKCWKGFQAHTHNSIYHDYHE